METTSRRRAPLYLPNVPPKPTLTYIDQLIRPSLRMRVQSRWDDVSIVMDTHNLNASKQTKTYLAPDRYHEHVLATHQMNDVFTHIQKDSKGDVIDDIDDDCNVMGIPNPPCSQDVAYKSTLAYMKRWPTKVKRIQKF